MDEDFDSYEPYEDDLQAWEDEQVYRDREEMTSDEIFDELDDSPFGIDGMGPDGE